MMARSIQGGSGVILVVDVGNSVTNLGLACEGALSSAWSVTTPDRLTADEALLCVTSFLQVRGCDAKVRDAIVSSVVPGLTDAWVEALHTLCGVRPLVVGPGLKSGLKLHLNSPADFGADRVADCVAAKQFYGFPLIVVDFGTATTLEVIDDAGVVQGGLIAPGLRLAARAVADAAAQLPVIGLHTPRSVIGKSTRDAMQAGIVIGEVARIDGLIQAVWDELGYETRVVATGDDAQAMAGLSRRIEVADDQLTLKGLILLHQKNRKAR